MPPGHDIQDALVESEALITDYSSLAWDALYVDKPVMFFRFDIDAYERERGAYLSLTEPLVGPVSRTPDEAVQLIEDFLVDASAWVELPQRPKWQSRAFAYRDGENSRRVYEAVLRVIATRRGAS